jgi:hypothetical protein
MIPRCSQSSPARLFILVVLDVLFLGFGCTLHHFEHNAPGHIDVERPPKRIECELVERPKDPGEEMVIVSLGPLAGAGVTLDPAKNASLQAELGVEGSLLLGMSEVSHADDFPIGVTPYQVGSLGINFGWVFSARHDPGTPLYLELQGRHKLFGLAAGWAWIVDHDGRGPQVTVFWGPFYVRYRHLEGVSDDFTAGLIMKLSLAFVWSR